MKRIIPILLLLCLITATASAAYDPFIPDNLIAKIIERLPISVEGVGVTDPDEIREYVDYLTLQLTDQEANVLYYDNTDWKAEIAFAFPGASGSSQQSNAINIVLSNEMDEDCLVYILYSVAEALAYDNTQMDADRLYSWMYWEQQEPDAPQTFESVLGTFTKIDNPNAAQFTLYSKSTASVTAAPQAAASPAPTSVPVSKDYLINEHGITLELTEIVANPTKYDPAKIDFRVNLVNNSGRTLDFYIKSATVNGVKVEGVGIFKVPSSTARITDKKFFVYSRTSEAEQAITHPKTATFELRIDDSDTDEILWEYTFTFDTSSVPSFTPYPVESSTPKPTAKPTPKPTSTPRVTSTPKASTSTSVASRKIQWLDFSERKYATWDYDTGNRLKIRFEVTSKQYPIKSFVMYVYATDLMGNRIWGDNFTYYFNTNRQMTSYITAWSDYVRLPDRTSINQVWCGIKSVTLRDGNTEEIPDSDIVYYYWTIK